MAWLWVCCGPCLLLGAAAVSAGPNRNALIVHGAATMLIGAALLRVDWRSVHPLALRTAPPLAMVAGTFTAWYTPATAALGIALLAVVAVWTGLALEKTDIGLLVALSIPMCWLLTETQGFERRPLAALALALASAVVAGAAHWMRLLLEDANESMQLAEAERLKAQARETQAADQARTAHAETLAAERETLSRQVAQRVAKLAETAQHVGSHTTAAVSATAETSAALVELTRNAEQAQHVTVAAAGRASDASTAMEALAAASEQIGAATDVINAIAEQTNLLALNATIESARAGEAGQGFAVVANEVKLLAAQSAANADRIVQTVGEVRDKVAAAVSHVDQITDDMGVLADGNAELAAATSSQSELLNALTRQLEATAIDVVGMVDDVEGLKTFAAQGVDAS